MSRTLLKFALMIAAVSAAAGSATATLETQLRAQRPEITRWEIVEMAGSAARAAPQGDVTLVGRIAPRTAVRFSDGRVRWYAVAGFAPVMISAHGIAAGGEVTAANLEAAERDVIALGCQPLVSLDPEKPWRAARQLDAGEALCTSSLEPTPQVQRGREVWLSTERGPIHVSRVLVASNDAWTGERVRLRDPASGETVPAVVTGASAARSLNPGERK